MILLRSAILFILLCATVPLQAQHIATDFNSCLHGVQGKDGNWIIRPEYEQLEGTAYGYIGSKGGRYGIIDSSGKVLINFQYDYVTSGFYPYYSWGKKIPPYYRVTIGDYFGILDTGNRVIVPIRYSSIEYTPDTTFIVRESEDTWAFYNRHGQKFNCPWKSKFPPRYLISHYFAIQKRRLIGRDLYGMVNDSGRIILPQEYHRLNGHSGPSVIRVVKNKRYSFCNTAGKMFWPMVLMQTDKGGWWDYNGEMTGRLARGPAVINGKSGIISVYGDTLLPFEYDRIESFENYPAPRATGNLWIVTKDSLKGIFDDVNGWMIPPFCTYIDMLETYYADGDSAQVGLMIYQRAGLWGVITTSGQEVLPCIYEESEVSNYGTWVFRKKDELIVLGLVTNTHIRHLRYRSYHPDDHNLMDSPGSTGFIETIPSSKKLSAYQGEENTTIYYHPGLTQTPVELHGYTFLFNKGNSYDFVAPDSIIRSACFYTQTLRTPDVQNGTVNMYRLDFLIQHSKNEGAVDVIYVKSNTENKISFNIQYFDNNNIDFIITSNEDVVTRNGRLIMSGDSNDYVYREVHGTSGEPFFVGTRFDSGSLVFDTNGIILAPRRDGGCGDYSAKYVWREIEKRGDAKWFLADIKTGNSVLPAKEFSNQDAPVWDSITIVDNDKNGARIYNINRKKYLNSKGFSYIMPLSTSGTAFVIKTCSGNIGVMRADGTWMADTIWKAITPFGLCKEIEDPWNTNIDYSTFYHDYHVLSNDTGAVLVNLKLNTVVSTDQCWPFIWYMCTWKSSPDYLDLFETHFVYDRNDNNEDQQPYFMIPDMDTSAYKAWHKKIIVDTLFGSLRTTVYYDYPSEYGNEEYEWWDIDEQNRTNRYCASCGSKYQDFMWTRDGSKGTFGTSWMNDSVISFSEITKYQWSSYAYRDNYSNVFLFSDGPRNMLLDSLFDPGSDWKNMIINTVLDYLNTHKNIEGDCHNPAGLPALLNNQWQINNNELVLYPPGFTEEAHDLSISIPLKTLEPFLRMDVKSKLGLHH